MSNMNMVDLPGEPESTPDPQTFNGTTVSVPSPSAAVLAAPILIFFGLLGVTVGAYFAIYKLMRHRNSAGKRALRVKAEREGALREAARVNKKGMEAKPGASHKDSAAWDVESVEDIELTVRPGGSV